MLYLKMKINKLCGKTIITNIVPTDGRESRGLVIGVI